jgi:Leucine-rich repeat (LRR) protein
MDKRVLGAIFVNFFLKTGLMKKIHTLVLLLAFGCVAPLAQTSNKLTKALENPKSVTELVIKNNPFIKSLPPEIGKMKNLKVLYLFRVGLDSIPKEIGELENLEVLVLSANKLTSLPPEIGKLKKLKRLSVQHNRLTSLPPEIGNLENLEELRLHNNRLTYLPNEVGYLPKLQLLDLSMNRIAAIPRTIGALASLRQLNLSNNQLQTIPNDIGFCRELNYVGLYNAGFMLRIPETFYYMQKLVNITVDEHALLPYCIYSINPYLTVTVYDVHGRKHTKTPRSKTRSVKYNYSLFNY